MSRFKKGLLMYIGDNAMNDHKGNFSKTEKKYLHKLPVLHQP